MEVTRKNTVQSKTEGRKEKGKMSKAELSPNCDMERH